MPKKMPKMSKSRGTTASNISKLSKDIKALNAKLRATRDVETATDIQKQLECLKDKREALVDKIGGKIVD